MKFTQLCKETLQVPNVAKTEKIVSKLKEKRDKHTTQKWPFHEKFSLIYSLMNHFNFSSYKNHWVNRLVDNQAVFNEHLAVN